ncbi:MAG: hypothetical protein ACR2OJ_12555 [Hyphomicrobiales bacterium]
MNDFTPNPATPPRAVHDENAARLYHTLELMAHPDVRGSFENLTTLTSAQMAKQTER